MASRVSSVEMCFVVVVIVVTGLHVGQIGQSVMIGGGYVTSEHDGHTLKEM